MSLLEEAFDNLTIVNKSVVDDGYGGVTTEWTDGATIQGALVHDNSTQAKIAEKMGVTELYTLTVRRDIVLDYHSVVKRADGTIFRITSDSDDEKTPMSAGLDMRQYSCERWQLS